MSHLLNGFAGKNNEGTNKVETARAFFYIRYIVTFISAFIKVTCHAVWGKCHVNEIYLISVRRCAEAKELTEFAEGNHEYISQQFTFKAGYLYGMFDIHVP